MSPRFLLPLFLVLLAATTLSAQIHIEPGLSFGRQSYANNAERPRNVGGAEVLVRGANLGVHLAIEYSDLETWDALTVTHIDGAYRRSFGNQWAWLAGAGATFVDIGDFGTDENTFNVEAEIAKRFGRADVFARARYFDFTLGDFRTEVSPEGPEVAVGVRFALR